WPSTRRLSCRRRAGRARGGLAGPRVSPETCGRSGHDPRRHRSASVADADDDDLSMNLRLAIALILILPAIAGAQIRDAAPQRATGTAIIGGTVVTDG